MSCHRRGLVAGAGLCLALVGGCDRDESEPATSAAAAAPTDLAKALAEASSATPIVITDEQILVGTEQVPAVELAADRAASDSQGAPEKAKGAGPRALHLAPLAAELKKQGKASVMGEPEPGSLDARIIADGATPYQRLLEVLYTLAESGYGTFHLLATDADGATRGRLAVAPSFEKGRATSGREAPAGARAGSGDGAKLVRELQGPLSVVIVDQGYRFVTRIGLLVPSCQGKAPAGARVTVPLDEGRYDTAGLARCAEKVKRQHPEITRITIAAEPDVPYRVVLQTMDAIQGGPGGALLFPFVQFGVLR